MFNKPGTQMRMTHSSYLVLGSESDKSHSVLPYAHLHHCFQSTIGKSEAVLWIPMFVDGINRDTRSHRRSFGLQSFLYFGCSLHHKTDKAASQSFATRVDKSTATQTDKTDYEGRPRLEAIHAMLKPAFPWPLGRAGFRLHPGLGRRFS